MKWARLLFTSLALLLVSCSAAAQSELPKEQAQFIDELTWMVFGDKDRVTLRVGYPIGSGSILQQADRPQPAGEMDGTAFGAAFRYLDPAYNGKPGYPPRSNLFFVSTQRADPTAARVGRIARFSFEPYRSANAAAPVSERVSSLAFLTQAGGSPDRLRPHLATLLGAPVPAGREIEPGCTLYQSVDAAGYVDRNVVAMSEPADSGLDLRQRSTFLCMFAAQIVNLGFSDAVTTGRYRQFPMAKADMSGCVMPIASAERPAPRSGPCFSPVLRRAHLLVARHLVTSGRLHSGEISRRAFHELALAAARDLTFAFLLDELASEGRLPRNERDTIPPFQPTAR
ncbi:MAG TPA: hypothetical protein VGD66_13335 [Allosphingosinicella sp.]|jgi:hypothetical protein